MTRAIVILAVGAIFGAAITYVIIDSSKLSMPEQGTGTARTIQNIPKMTESDAALHRADRYEKLQSVEDIMALPTEFWQVEALYVLTGRSDSSGIQNLIYESNEIAEAVDRERTLTILFSRLTELDPASALAMSRTSRFSDNSDIESGVWRSWGRLDLDAALLAVQAQGTSTQRNHAAQALFSAYGYLGNETTDKIERVLNIRPDRRTRASYLYKLANRSPSEAIIYVSNIQSSLELEQSVSWLAHHLASKDPDRALGYAALFSEEEIRRYFESIVSSSLAAVNPAETLDRLLSGTDPVPGDREIYNAVRELASRDLDSALAYFDQIRSSDLRRKFGQSIIEELVRDDPQRAIRWANDNDTGDHSMLLTQVLRRIARTDPDLAIETASKITDSMQRLNVVTNIVMTISRSDPLKAAAMVGGIENKRERANAESMLATSWAREDPDSALGWLLGSDLVDKKGALFRMGENLVEADVDAAIRLLPRLDEANAAGWRKQIAQTLAADRSLAEAQNFINQFEGSPDYGRLQAAVAGGVATDDIAMAKQLADQLPAGADKDRAYSKLIMSHAETDPAEAAVWLSSIIDEQQRASATGRLVYAWNHQDPEAAFRWADNLPRGTTRDDAIVGLAASWEEMTPGRRLLMDSIGSAEKKTQASLGRIRFVARDDWQKAQSMLDALNLSQAERQRTQRMIDYYRDR